jgi:hypothetical protein
VNQPKEETFMPFIIGSGTSESASASADPVAPAGDFTQPDSFDPLGGFSEKKRFNTGSLILAGVVVVACTGLWFMRSLSKASAANEGNKEVEASIEKFLSSLTGDSKKGSKPSSALASDANVQKNPFILFDEPIGANPTDGSDPGLAKRQADRRKQFESAAAKLELKSVLMGSNPLANVSGKIVRVGEEIVTGQDGVALRVTEITKESVTVMGEDVSLNLSMPFTIVLKR